MKPLVTLVVLSALLLPTLALADDVDFVDVATQHQAAAAIQRVVKAGVVAGYPDHTFRGWKPVTRYELLASTARLLPAEGPTTVAGPVLLASDVEATHWAFPALARFHGVGIGQQLWADGRLRGDQPATRFDLAYLATQACGAWLPLTGAMAGFPTFGDVPEGHWAAPAVRQAAELGLMGGLAADQFGGDQPIDRFQLAVVLDRVMARVRVYQPAAAASDVGALATGTDVAVPADARMAPVAALPVVGGQSPAPVSPKPIPLATTPAVVPAKPAQATPAKPKPAAVPSAKPKSAVVPSAKPKPATVKPTPKPKPGKPKPTTAKAKPVSAKASPAKTPKPSTTAQPGRKSAGNGRH